MPLYDRLAHIKDTVWYGDFIRGDPCAIYFVTCRLGRHVMAARGDAAVRRRDALFARTHLSRLSRIVADDRKRCKTFDSDASRYITHTHGRVTKTIGRTTDGRQLQRYEHISFPKGLIIIIWRVLRVLSDDWWKNPVARGGDKSSRIYPDRLVSLWPALIHTHW